MKTLNNKKIVIENIEYWYFDDLIEILGDKLDLKISIEHIKTIIYHCNKNGLDVGTHCKNIGKDLVISKYSCYILIDKLEIENKELKRKFKDYFYHKDYEGWNNEKQRIDKLETRKYVNKREIWNCKLGINIGNEANGKGKYLRPVLIIERIGGVYFVVPLTKNGKNEGEKSSEYYYKLKDNIFDFDSYIMLSQIKTIDKNRLVKNEGKISENDFEEIKNRLQKMYFTND